jgi:hypothetical protein
MKRLPLLVFALVLGCGNGDASAPARLQAGIGTPEGVEIQGTIAAGGPDIQKLLVFAYANAATVGSDPASLGAVSLDRSFALSNVPAGDATILFLIDAKNDGVIDPGDSVATLEDPERQLAGLKAGDIVLLQDVTINAAQGKAAAAAITVKHAPGPPSEATGAVSATP